MKNLRVCVLLEKNLYERFYKNKINVIITTVTITTLWKQ